MKFSFSLFKKRIPSEYFLALLFRDEQIHAVVFEQIDGRIQVIGEGKEKLPVALDRASDEMLLDTSDKAISIAESSLPNGIQTHKTVFGVKETWVEDARITKTYLDKLKTISDQLDLKPIGFLVFPEAIAHLLQKEEGAPVSAIFVEPGEKQVTITLIRAGRIIGTKEVASEESITTTVENGLKLFEHIEIFPSRIIVFDGQEEHIEKKFLTHHWSKALPFLHVPQITTLPNDFDTRAVLFGTATQMGLDAIDLVKKPLKTAQAFFEQHEEREPARQHKEEIAEESETTEAENAKIEEEQKEKPEEATEVEEVTGKDTSEYFGFVRDADVAKTATDIHKTALPDEAMESVTEEVLEEEKESEIPTHTALGFSASGPIFFEGAKKMFAQLKRIASRAPSTAKISSVTNQATQMFAGGPKILFLIPVIILFVIGGFLWYIFGVKATVKLSLTPKVISQDQAVTFTTSGNADASKDVIAAQQITVTEEGKVSGDATGTKDVGTPAKGTVTIFNSDNQSHTLTKGTTITSSSGPTFTLDNDVTVASASGDIFSGTKPGTADVSVTATAIGTDSNLPSNTKFTITGTAALAAKNANAFSGGTKSSIVVVSQKDLDNLVTQLTNNLKDKAKADLQNKISADTVILPDFTNTSASQKSFDKKVGDQAQSISLDATITYETISYKKSDLESFTKTLLSSKFPSGLTLSPDGVTYSVKDISTKDGTIKATLTAKASLIPTIDTKTLAGQIAGKSFASARDILSGVPQFSDSTFTLSPNLFFLHTLPRLSQNITISISTND